VGVLGLLQVLTQLHTVLLQSQGVGNWLYLSPNAIWSPLLDLTPLHCAAAKLMMSGCSGCQVSALQGQG